MGLGVRARSDGPRSVPSCRRGCCQPAIPAGFPPNGPDSASSRRSEGALREVRDTRSSTTRASRSTLRCPHPSEPLDLDGCDVPIELLGIERAAVPMTFDLTGGEASDSPRFPILLAIGPDTPPGGFRTVQAVNERGTPSRAKQFGQRQHRLSHCYRTIPRWTWNCHEGVGPALEAEGRRLEPCRSDHDPGRQSPAASRLGSSRTTSSVSCCRPSEAARKKAS